jgi:nitroreductase
MDFKEIIELRRSVRKYKKEDIPLEKIESVLNAARLAPSWGNVQPWRFVIVKDDETKKKLAHACKGQKHVERAPVVIVCCGDTNAWKEQGKRLFELADMGALKVPKDFIEKNILTDATFNPQLAGMGTVIKRTHEQVLLAIQNMHLAAVNEGLGSCIVAGGLEEESVKSILNIPAEVVVTALLPLGYPETIPPQTKKLTLADIIFKEKWGCR